MDPSIHTASHANKATLPRPNRYDLYAINVLWRRDLKRFFRQPSRIVGALGQPIIFWLVIGTGMTATFQMPADSAMSYLEFFFPGVVMMVLLFASIFSAVSVIDDRRQGFLQAVMAGPASRTALVVGKCAGSSLVALIQAGLFMCLLPATRFTFAQIHWPLLLTSLTLTALGLTAMGFLVAWWLDNVQGYHAIQMTLLVPLWIVSGAMFPPQGQPGVFSTIMRANPLAYAVSAARHGFYDGHAPAASVLALSPWICILVTGIFAAMMLYGAVAVCKRK